jgi:hypothetical protein
MRNGRGLHILIIVMVFAGMLLAQVYGCGNSTDHYVEKVLNSWPGIEVRAEQLVEEFAGLSEEGGLERFWLLAGEARQGADSFRSTLSRRTLVPAYQENFNMLLTSFLASYGSYLKGLQDYLDVVLVGVEGEPPDIVSLATEARQALGDYQNAQEYNGAKLDEDVWGLAGALLSINGWQAEETASPATLPLEAAPVPGPEEAVSSWYDLFNQGSGEAMYFLLSPYSPILEEYGAEDFINRIEGANASGLQVASEVGNVEAEQEDGLDWAIVQVAVEYGEYTGEDGEVVPPVREEFSVELDYVDGQWMITRVNSPSLIW